MKWFILDVALLVVACGSAAPRAPQPRRDVVDEVATQVMARAGVPAMAIAVVQDGEVRVRRAYGVGNLEWPSPVTPATRFQIASSTKVFTGTLVMMLVEDGTLALDRSVASYLPDAPAAWNGMTLRHLVAHAAGVPDHLDSTIVSAREAYEVVKPKPLLFAPGHEVRYASGDFIVLAHLLETVTGRSFEALLEERIFRRLGFTCTGFEHETEEGQVRLADVVSARAVVYRRVDGRQRAAKFLYPQYTYASGGALSCLDDLVKWAVAMDRQTLLTPASERVLATSFQPASGGAAGFGVVFATGTLRGRAWYGHSGGPALADVVVVPSARLSVIVLANQQRLVPNIAARLASEWLPPGPTPAALPDAAPARTLMLRALAEGMRTGVIDDAVLAHPTALAPTLRTWGPLQLAALPALDELVLVEDAPTRRRYHARYGRVTGMWRFDLDAAGRVVDLDFTIP